MNEEVINNVASMDILYSTVVSQVNAAVDNQYFSIIKWFNECVTSQTIQHDFSINQFETVVNISTNPPKVLEDTNEIDTQTDSYTGEDVNSLIEKYRKLTVVDLKKEMKKVGLKPRGLKRDLVKQLAETHYKLQVEEWEKSKRIKKTTIDPVLSTPSKSLVSSVPFEVEEKVEMKSIDVSTQTVSKVSVGLSPQGEVSPKSVNDGSLEGNLSGSPKLVNNGDISPIDNVDESQKSVNNGDVSPKDSGILPSKPVNVSDTSPHAMRDESHTPVTLSSTSKLPTETLTVSDTHPTPLPSNTSELEKPSEPSVSHSNLISNTSPKPKPIPSDTSPKPSSDTPPKPNPMPSAISGKRLTPSDTPPKPKPMPSDTPLKPSSDTPPKSKPMPFTISGKRLTPSDTPPKPSSDTPPKSNPMPSDTPPKPKPMPSAISEKRLTPSDTPPKQTPSIIVETPPQTTSTSKSEKQFQFSPLQVTNTVDKKIAPKKSKLSSEEKIHNKTLELLQRVEDMKKRKEERQGVAMQSQSKSRDPLSKFNVFQLSNATKEKEQSVLVEELSLPALSKGVEKPVERSFISFISSPKVNKKIPMKSALSTQTQQTQQTQEPVRPLPRRVPIQMGSSVSHQVSSVTSTLRPSPPLTSSIAHQPPSSLPSTNQQPTSMQSSSTQQPPSTTNIPSTPVKRDKPEGEREEKREKSLQVAPSKLPSNRPPVEPEVNKEAEMRMLNVPEANGLPWHDNSNIGRFALQQHLLLTKTDFSVDLIFGQMDDFQLESLFPNLGHRSRERGSSGNWEDI